MHILTTKGKIKGAFFLVKLLKAPVRLTVNMYLILPINMMKVQDIKPKMGTVLIQILLLFTKLMVVAMSNLHVNSLDMYVHIDRSVPIFITENILEVTDILRGTAYLLNTNE